MKMLHIGVMSVCAISAVIVSATPSRAVVITSETATTSNTFSGGAGPVNVVVDNTGNTSVGSPSLAIDGDYEHDDEAASVWQTGGGIGDVGGALGETLTIDLGANYDLDGMRIWNYNFTNGTDTAISVYDLETSPDGGSYVLRQDNQGLAQAPLVNVDSGDQNQYDGVYTPISWLNVRYVRFTVVDTYRGSDDIAGLSEVMFSGVAAAVPEPASFSMLGVVTLLLLRRRA